MGRKSPENKTDWKWWLLPVVIGGAMATGSLLGIASFSHEIHDQGPTGDLAGAAGALIVMLCLLSGVCLALIVVMLARIKGVGELRNISLRLILSIVGGITIGALGIKGGMVATAIFWSLLAALPVLLALPWQKRGKRVPGENW